MIERIADIIGYLKTQRIALSQAELAQMIGIKPSQLSEMMSGKRVISERTIRKITDAFPMIDGDWLLTGEGDMLNDSCVGPKESDNAVIISTGKVIPYFDAEVAAGTSYGMDMVQTHQVGMIEIGGLLKDSEFALRVYGNSMTPNYPAGCVVGLKQHSDSFIEPGTVYVVETSNNRYLKRLYYNKVKDAFRCISDNTMKHESGPMDGEYFYQEFEIPLTDIARLLRVTGVIKRNIL